MLLVNDDYKLGTLSEYYYKLDAYVYIKLIESDIINYDYKLGTCYLNLTSLMPMFMSC